MGAVYVAGSDTVFPTEYEPGDREPECSRCGKRIPEGIRFVRAALLDEPGECRYHVECAEWAPEYLVFSEN